MKRINATGIVKIMMLICLVFTMFLTAFAQFQMEWDKQILVNETWTQINLSTFFIDPIVVATPEYSVTTQSFGISTWITNVTNTSFMLRTADENFGSTDNITVHYLVVERGEWTLPGTTQTIQAGSLETNKFGDNTVRWSCPTEGEIVSFNTPFSSSPLLMSTRGSDNNPNAWANTFQHEVGVDTGTVSTTQMCIGLSQSKAVSPGAITNNETIYWIGVDEGNGFVEGTEYEVLWNARDTGDSGANWINGYADALPFTQSWTKTWSGAPNIIIASQTSVGGSDGSWPVIYDTGDIGSIRMFVDEANERSHAGSESGGGFAFNNSDFIEAPNNVTWSSISLDVGFGVITDGNISNTITIESYKTNSNISITCLSGDCSRITTNFTSITLNHGETNLVDFTCSNETTGIFNALFGINSTEDVLSENLNVTCQIFKEFGDLGVSLVTPLNGSFNSVAQNRTFNLEIDITCSGDANTSCGNVSAYPRYNGSLLDLGDGSDGILVVNSLNTVVNDYTYLTGNELSGSTSLGVNDVSSFGTGDSILLIQMQNGSGIGISGQYEYATIDSISGSDIIIDTPISNSYGSGTFNSVSSSVTQIVRIPQYSLVTINNGASITSPAWNGFSGGIVTFRSLGDTTMVGSGFINVSEKGFRGGTCGACGNSDWGTQGEGYLGLGGESLTPNGNGGGGGYGPSGFGGEGGAGGGHATTGGNSISSFPSTGGNSIGNSNLTSLFFGGGAGGGGDNDGATPFPENVDGGGIVIIFSKEIQNATIEAKGEVGIYSSGAGGVTGSGAGGSIYLLADVIEVNTLDALGGPAVLGSSPDVGGTGGDGRVALVYGTLNSGTSTPSSGSNSTIESGQIIISDTSGDLPLWSLDSQYQTCVNMEEGDTCTLSWEINASGEINSTQLLDVFVESNVPVVSSVTSDNFTVLITDNVIPVITLLSPLDDEKILTTSNSIDLVYSVEDDDTVLICDVFINEILNTSNLCFTSTNITYSIPITRGLYNWSVSVLDSLNNTVNSSVFDFTIIRNSSKFVSKEITYLTPNIYFNLINFTDSIGINESSKVFTTIDSSLNGGSYSPIYSSNILFVDFEMIFWNISSSSIFNYSTTASNSSYHLSKDFRIGLE
jgi:hypothetical protein